MLGSSYYVHDIEDTNKGQLEYQMRKRLILLLETREYSNKEVIMMYLWGYQQQKLLWVFIIYEILFLSHLFDSLNLRAILLDRDYGYPHYNNELIEGQKNQVTYPKPQS